MSKPVYKFNGSMQVYLGDEVANKRIGLEYNEIREGKNESS